MDVSYLICENPWPVAGVCLAVGLAAALWARSEGRAPPRWAGLALLAGGAVVVVAWVVETDREAVRTRMRAVLAAAEAHDVAGLTSYFRLPEVPAVQRELTQAALTREARAHLHEVTECRLGNEEFAPDAGGGVLYRPEVMALGPGGGRVQVRAWFTWRRERPDGPWVVVRLTDVEWRFAVGDWYPLGGRAFR